jgi:hypothetical protein
VRICVYLSASPEAARHFHEEARQLGRRLGAGGHSLVYGGGAIGTMGALAEGAAETGTRITSVIPRFFHDLELTFVRSDEIVLTEDLQERRRTMIERSDAAIALPGGFGTLEEIAEFLTLRQLGFHHKPLVLVDLHGYWEGYLAQTERMRREKMIHEDHRDLILIAPDAASAVDRLEAAIR